jgi:hypothetical protein
MNPEEKRRLRKYLVIAALLFIFVQVGIAVGATVMILFLCRLLP